MSFQNGPVKFLPQTWVKWIGASLSTPTKLWTNVLLSDSFSSFI